MQTTLLSFALKEKKFSSSWQKAEVKSIIFELCVNGTNLVNRKPDDLRVERIAESRS